MKDGVLKAPTLYRYPAGDYTGGTIDVTETSPKPAKAEHRVAGFESLLVPKASLCLICPTLTERTLRGCKKGNSRERPTTRGCGEIGKHYGLSPTGKLEHLNAGSSPAGPIGETQRRNRWKIMMTITRMLLTCRKSITC